MSEIDPRVAPGNLNAEAGVSNQQIMLYIAKGRDIWIRARTNAFAHRQAASHAGALAALTFAAETIFIVTSIVSVGLALQFTTSDTAHATHINQALGVVAIIANGIGLGVTIMGERFQWGEKKAEHANLMSQYQLIAQRARRLDNAGLSHDEAVHLCRSLEESFEIFKASNLEPNDRNHEYGQKMLLKLPNYPFGITRSWLNSMADPGKVMPTPSSSANPESAIS